MSAAVTTHPATAPTTVPPADTLGQAPRVLGLGGTLRAWSSSEKALRYALDAAAERGASTRLITAAELDLPMYDPDRVAAGHAEDLLAAVREADALVIATPGYHGNLSGLLKNALDYLQELADDPSPYLHDKAVGCIVTAAGWQAGAATLAALRATVHALRGWPTPLGVVINSAEPVFGPGGAVTDPKIAAQLGILGDQVVTFARRHRIGVDGRA